MRKTSEPARPASDWEVGFFGWIMAAVITYASTCARDKWLSNTACVALMFLVFYFVISAARTTAPRVLAIAAWMSTAFAPMGRFIFAGLGLVLFLSALAVVFAGRAKAAVSNN